MKTLTQLERFNELLDEIPLENRLAAQVTMLGWLLRDAPEPSFTAALVMVKRAYGTIPVAQMQWDMELAERAKRHLDNRPSRLVRDLDGKLIEHYAGDVQDYVPAAELKDRP